MSLQVPAWSGHNTTRGFMIPRRNCTPYHQWVRMIAIAVAKLRGNDRLAAYVSRPPPTASIAYAATPTAAATFGRRASAATARPDTAHTSSKDGNTYSGRREVRGCIRTNSPLHRAYRPTC